MDTKLWLMLMAMSAIISLSKQLDFSGLMGLSGTKEEPLKTNVLQNTNFNKQDGLHLQNKPGFQSVGDKFDNFDKFEKLDKTQNKTNFENSFKNEDPVVYIATPPTIDDGNSSHFKYNSQQSYGTNQQGTGQQVSTQYRRPGSNSYGNNNNNLTGYNAYRQMYGYNQGPNRRPVTYSNRPVVRPVYSQRPAQQQYQYQQQPRPQQPQQYQQKQYRPQQLFQYGSGTPQNSYNDQHRQYGNGQAYSSPSNYGNAGQSYNSGPILSYSGPSNGPVYSSGYDGGPVYDNTYDNSYNSNLEQEQIDYSQYPAPIPYQELSEYMSPAQYNEYNEKMYRTYKVPVPKYQNNNYSSKYNSSKEFKMSIAVVVLNSQLQTDSEKNKFGQNKFGQQGNFGQNKFGQNNKFGTRSVTEEDNPDYQSDQRTGLGSGGLFGSSGLDQKPDFQDKFQNSFDKQGLKGQRNVQGTLFITEIYPQVCIVSGVVTGLEPGRKFGIAVHELGDVTNGCNSIGDHYNPYHRNHGNINSEQSHIGDLGNIDADHIGVAHVNKISRFQFSVQSKNPVAGRSIGICQNIDDVGKGGTVASLKDGNCGTILACGVIGLSNTGGSESGHV